MPTKNVVLTDQQLQFVEQLVASGHYQNASEVLRHGLRLVQEHQLELNARLQSLQQYPFYEVRFLAEQQAHSLPELKLRLDS